jgi:hypothetical protein
MSEEDAAFETDFFLERSGPPSTEFPFHRDSYYMLEGTKTTCVLQSSGLNLNTAYLPNRSWNGEELRWMYMPALQHDRDVEMAKAWAAPKKNAINISTKAEDGISI